MSYFFAGDLITSNSSGIGYSAGDSGHETILRGPTNGNTDGTVVLRLPADTGTSGQVLQTNGSGVLSFATVGGSPAGSDTQLQYNNGSSFGAITGFTYNDATEELFLSSDLFVNTGKSSIVATEDTANALAIVSDGGTSSTLRILNDRGTDNAAIELTSSEGGITAKVADGKDLTLGNASGDAYFKVAASSDAVNEDVRIVNTNGTDNAAIAITSLAGGIDMDAAAAKDVNISGGLVTLVSKDNAASAISLTANQGTDETIVVTNTLGTNAAAIELNAIAGGITLAPGTSITTSKGFITSPYEFGISNTSALSTHQLMATTNNAVYLNLTDSDGTDTATIEVAGSNTAGQNMHLFFDNAGSNNLRLDFGNNLLTSGSGLVQYLTFSNTGQSASLMYVGSKWRIINTGAAVS